MLANASLFILFFLSLALLGFTASYLNLLGAGELLALLAGLAGLFFWFIPKIDFSFFSKKQAAWKLDEKLASSSRFTTLNSFAELKCTENIGEAKSYIEGQARKSLKGVSIVELFPIRLNPVCKPSLYVSPFAIILSLALLYFYEPLISIPERDNLSARETSEIREELDELPDLPDELEKGLQELGQKLLDEQVDDTELLEDIDKIN